MGRRPAAEEVSRLAELYQSELEYYRENPELARELLTSANQPAADELAAPELAAWTILSSVLLNLDETLTKG